MCCPTDGDIYGSEGQYIRYEEGTWDSPEAYEDVSSGHPYANPRGRPGSARPSHSYGADRFSDDNMADGDAYVTPQTTAPLQAAGQVSTFPLPSPSPPFSSCHQETMAPLQAAGKVSTIATLYMPGCCRTHFRMQSAGGGHIDTQTFYVL